MADENSQRIWRPSVKPNDVLIPHPGVKFVPDQVFTKTSLRANEPGKQSLANLNKQIIDATQAFNNSPKPFVRQDTPQVESSPLKRGTKQANTVQPCLANLRNQPLKEAPSCDESNTGEEMAPKLIHKQYNSPLDLYSMNNIRKTIEAHSEFIAPGVKGINFLKGDGSVNKQSEVYKLVMEEETGKSSQTISQSSTIAASPAARDPSIDRTSSLGAQQTTRPQVSDPSGFIQQRNVETLPSKGMSSAQKAVNHVQVGSTTGANTGPTCHECGRSIVGPFARLQNRYVHPQCFNCTTCGTSLKNTGFFTVNDKLYCDIHVKQVANMMNISYDFEKQSQKGEYLDDDSKQTQLKSMDNPRAQYQQTTQQLMTPTRRQEHQVSATSSPSSSSNYLHSAYSRQLTMDQNMRSPATISTMFADRGASGNEVRWSWRPAVGVERNHLAAPLPTSGVQELSQAPISSRATSQMTRSVNLQSGSRVPICFNCHVQIHGPYILAGKSTWCKVCSQVNFNCGSCRRPLLDIGFIEDENTHKYYCESCYEAYFVPICAKCNLRIKGDCLNALSNQWHPSCFVCGHCKQPFGNSSFYLEDHVPYCERDWNLLFTTKCFACSYPIEAGDKWIEALDRNYHSQCFKCTSCQAGLEGSTFYCKNGKPYCRLHAL